MATTDNNAAGATAAPVKAKRKRGDGPVVKRPAYLVYSIGEDGELVIHTATRKADEVLNETAGQAVKKYAKFEI